MINRVVSPTTSLGLALATAGVAFVLASGCRDSGGPSTFGEPVAVRDAVPLARFLSAAAPTSEMVVVSGRIGQICASAGCWFTLEDSVDGKSFHLLVDLKPAASFLVATSMQGRAAVVKGRLVNSDGDLQLNAVGLLVIP